MKRNQVGVRRGQNDVLVSVLCQDIWIGFEILWLGKLGPECDQSPEGLSVTLKTGGSVIQMLSLSDKSQIQHKLIETKRTYVSSSWKYSGLGLLGFSGLDLHRFCVARFGGSNEVIPT